MDGNSSLCKCLIQNTHQPADSLPCDWIPAVHAGMTVFLYLAGSQDLALVVIHKWLKPVIPAWTAGIQSQGGESAGW